MRFRTTGRSTQTLSHSQLLRLIGVFSLLLLGSACEIQEPVMPAWAVELNLPLAEDTFNIGEELINDSTVVCRGADSLIYIQLNGELDPVEMNAADFATPDIDTVQSVVLGNIELNNLEALNSGDITLGAIFPELANLIVPGLTVPVALPDTVITPETVVLNASDFVGLHVVDGQLLVSFTNNLPFALGPNSNATDGLAVIVRDNRGITVAEVFFDEVIQPGNTLERTSSLGGSRGWLYAPLEIEYTLPVPGVTFNLNESVFNNASVSLESELENVVVDEASARLDAQSISSSESFALDGDTRIREVVLEDGWLALSFSNQTELATEISYSIPAITSDNGEALSGSIFLDANGSQNLNLSLSGYRIADPDVQGNLLDEISVSYTATTQSTNDIISVRATDQIQVGVFLSGLRFERFTGQVTEEIFEIDPFEERDLFDTEDFPSDIRLSQANLALTLENEVYIENMYVDLVLTGYHEENGQVTDSVVLAIDDQQIQPGHPGSAVQTVINLSGREVADFINILPNRIRTTGQVRGGGNVEVEQASRVRGSYAFETPLRFTIAEAAYLDGEGDTVLEDDVDQDIRDLDPENFEQATLTLNMQNSTPLGASVRLLITSDTSRADMFNFIELDPNREFLKESALGAANTDPVSGFVVTPENSTVELSLTREEFRILQNPPFKLAYQVVIDATPGEVAIRATDQIRISGLVRLSVMIKE